MSTQPAHPRPPRVVVISGGTDGMGRALALERAARGDTVVAIGSNPDKGRRLLDEAARLGGGRVDFIQTDLSSIIATRAAIDGIAARYEVVDALALFANRGTPKRSVTAEGLERTFALYYLSRYLLGHGLSPALRRSTAPVIVNVAGVGTVRGQIHWDDLQLEHGYSLVAAQLQAGRANDLLGVAFAAQPDNPITYVLYHPGFTRSGDLDPLPAPARVLIRVAARLFGRPIHQSIDPIHDFFDNPPTDALTAIDRGTRLPLTLSTLDPANAERLQAATRALLGSIDSGRPG